MPAAETLALSDRSPDPQRLTLSIDLIDPFGPVEAASVRPAAELLVADLNRECEAQRGVGRFFLGQVERSAAGDRFKFEVRYEGGESAPSGEAHRIIQSWSEGLMQELGPDFTIRRRGMGELPPAP